MKSAKKTVGFSVIAVGVVFAFFIFYSGKGPNVYEVVNTQSAPPDTHNDTAMGITNAVSENNVTPRTESVPVAADNDVGSESGSKNNLTKSFAGLLAKQVLTSNPSGPAGYQGESSISMPNEVNIQKFIADNYGSLDWRSLTSEIKDSRIKITADNSVASQRKFFWSQLEITSKIFAGIDFKKAADSQDKTDALAAAKTLVDHYTVAIADLYAQPTPSNLTDFHKREIALVTAQKNLYEKIAATADDPLASIVAIKTLPEIDKQFSTLSTDVTAYIFKNNL